MEKDHFLDRHPLVNEHDAILPGDEVFICLKNMQQYAKELQDLTKITVSNYLTSQEYHPRGQKVKGFEKIWDEKNLEYVQEERVGRITYKIINGNVVPTKEGYKYIKKYNKNKLKLVKYEEIKDSFLLVLVFKFNDFKFKIIIDDWKYFDSIEEVQEYIKKQKITSPKLFMDKISLIQNNRPEDFNKIDIYYNNKRLKISLVELFEYLINTYESSNNTSFYFNKYFNLILDCFELKNPIMYSEN